MEMSFSMIKARIGEAQDAAERRRAPRYAVEVDARVRELGAEGVEARVLNISESGFMAETDGEFDVGTRVWLMLPGRSLGGRRPHRRRIRRFHFARRPWIRRTDLAARRSRCTLRRPFLQVSHCCFGTVGPSDETRLRFAR